MGWEQTLWLPFSTRFNGGKMRTWRIGLLVDVGVVPTAEQRFFFATQAAGAAMGPGGQQFSLTALMLAQAIVDKCETFDMPLPRSLYSGSAA
jgi:hypothetical protein